MTLYRLLLRLYPASFRDEYRAELQRAFAEKTRGRSAPAVVAAAIADVVPNAIGAHWEHLRHGASGGLTLPTFGSDVRFALRLIARAPTFSAVVIVVIALGIGINAALFTTLHTVVWQPAPGIAPDAQLARLAPTALSGKNNRRYETSLSYPDILDLRERRDVFADVAAWTSGSLATDLGAGVEEVQVSFTTGNYFRVLRVTMAAGTGFPDDVERTAAPIAVIGHSIWMAHFGGSPEAIGKTIRILNQPFTVVGVAPELFSGINVNNFGRATAWVPLSTRPMLQPATRDYLIRRDATFLSGVVRLAPGVKARDVDQLTTVLATQIGRDEPTSHRSLSIGAERLAGMKRGASDTRETIIAFMVVGVLVVIITCTNVSALLLGRAVSRRREIGVRLALGATRLRIIRQMLTESLILALAGAALGSLLYFLSIKVAFATISDVIFALNPEPVTLLFAMLFAIATTFVFGLAPALHATRADLGEVMKNSGALSIQRSRLQATFVVAQLAFSIPALVVTSLVLADTRRDMNDNADKAPASVVTMYAEFYNGSRYASGDTPAARDSVATAARTTLGLMRQRLEQVAGVQLASITVSGGGGESFEVPGGGIATTRIKQVHVSAGYFATLGIPLVRGRAIDAQDDHRGSTAAVVNESAAKLLWPGQNPIGKQVVRHSGDSSETVTLEVIGLAGTAPYEEERDVPQILVPMSSTASAGGSIFAVRAAGGALAYVPYWGGTLSVRTSGDGRRYVPAMRSALREIEPFATINDVSTLAEQYASRRHEAVLTSLAAFAVGVAALLLASLGLYAIIAFAVEQRTREIGIRLAVGATSGDVVRQFFRDGLIVTAIGLAIGLPLTVAGIRVIKASVLGFTLQNVATVMMVVPVLIGIAALASWLPARRAGRVEPLVALRSE